MCVPFMGERHVLLFKSEGERCVPSMSEEETCVFLS